MKLQTLSAVLATSLLLPACGVNVDRDDQGHRTKVDIHSPFGNVNVRTDVDASATGLPVYPGARPLRNRRDEPESADVNVGNSWFGVKVVALRFEHDDAPEPIVEYYKSALKTYGDVLECHGNIDFRHGSHAPVCKERERSRETQLVVGSEERHRLVVVKPRGSGSEFSAVYIQTRGTT
ncbi:MAG TPA: hypothetical protein VKB50_05120 [Vicinamibacterales bacterium]|nr:hypothetical protein [Vicinamibacterales bacterium]